MSETLFIHQNSVLNKRDAFLQQKQVSESFHFISMLGSCMAHSLSLMNASHRSMSVINLCSFPDRTPGSCPRGGR